MTSDGAQFDSRRNNSHEQKPQQQQHLEKYQNGSDQFQGLCILIWLRNYRIISIELGG
jgi:hypothetical protein